MKEKNNRRSFLKNLTISGLGVTAMPSVLFADESKSTLVKNLNSTSLQKTGKAQKPDKKRKYNGVYSGEFLKRVAFPIGGIGAGMFCLEGTGAISHMSVRHRPEIFHEPAMFAAIAIKGEKTVAKVIEGPVPDWKMFGQRGAGNGSAGSVFGLPRFSNVEFTTRFPFGYINLKDEDLPLTVQITGWSPFIPTDEDSASLPVGALEYKFVNKGNKAVDAVFSYNSRNFIVKDDKATAKKISGKSKIEKIVNGFVLSQEATAERPDLQGHFAIFTDNAETSVDHCWFRGAWWDPLT
nr:hypothetical protein [Chitinophagaceae bacterium]